MHSCWLGYFDEYLRSMGSWATAIVTDSDKWYYADNACNQEEFQISSPQFVWEAEYETIGGKST